MGAGGGGVGQVLTIVAALSVGGLSHIFYRPKDRAEESDSAREKFAVRRRATMVAMMIITIFQN